MGRDGRADPRQGSGEVASSGIDLEKGREFWAFQPPRPATPPAAATGTTAIDRFVNAALAEKGLSPVGPADKRTLLRRTYFDLWGLPPTPEAVDAFLADESAEAFETVVDELLASPHYGERWARHWLDVARYAEDQAHTFAVKPKTGAYQYRDWVIAAFNDDMPFDRFARLQIAGDLMPESAGDRFTRLAGLGFIGLGAEVLQELGQGTGDRRRTRRPGRHPDPRVPRSDRRVRPLPRPQVRPDPAAGLLLARRRVQRV